MRLIPTRNVLGATRSSLLRSLERPRPKLRSAGRGEANVGSADALRAESTEPRTSLGVMSAYGIGGSRIPMRLRPTISESASGISMALRPRPSTICMRGLAANARFVEVRPLGSVLITAMRPGEYGGYCALVATHFWGGSRITASSSRNSRNTSPSAVADNDLPCHADVLLELANREEIDHG